MVSGFGKTLLPCDRIMSEIPYGFCHCGCGGKPNLIKYPSRGVVGTPYRFVKDHKASGSKHPQWTGGITQEPDNGYIKYNNLNGKQVREHQVVAELIFGGPLPPGYVVHHKNEIRNDNRPENIHICESNSEHQFIHMQNTALAECGHANWRKCKICHEYDDINNMVVYGKAGNMHKECNRIAQKNLRDKRKLEGNPIRRKPRNGNR